MSKYTVNMIPPIFPYTGNKSKSINLILSHLPTDTSHFVDVFGGSGVVGMNVAANTDMTVTYNDIDRHINTLMFHCLNTSYFIIMIENEDNNYPETKEGYLALRTKYNTTHESPEKYARLYCLLARSFSNMCRHNSKGGFNAPFGERNHLRLDALKQAKEALKSKPIGLLGAGYGNVLTAYSHARNSILYLDCPYSITSASYNTGWSEQDDINLHHILDKLTLNGTKWMYHNVTHNRGKENFQLIQWLENNSYKVVDSNGDFRNTSFRKSDKPTREVLIMNY